MSMKAIFPPGVTALILNGLHQWDYGRKLQIHSDSLPAVVEVHFACAGMDEAVVRTCSVVEGVAEAAIPDRCLEQTAPISVWVYEIGETSGVTTKTITLFITAREKPQPAETIPEEISDKYTELIGAVNEQVEALKGGAVTVNRALLANNADNSTHADNATRANSSARADSATYADNATNSETSDGAPKQEGEVQTFSFGNQNGFGIGDDTVHGFFELWANNNIGDASYYCNLVPSKNNRQILGWSDKYFRGIYVKNIYTANIELDKSFVTYESQKLDSGTYQVIVDMSGTKYTATVYFKGTETHTMLGVSTTAYHALLELVVTSAGELKVYTWSDANNYNLTVPSEIKYRKIL